VPASASSACATSQWPSSVPVAYSGQQAPPAVPSAAKPAPRAPTYTRPPTTSRSTASPSSPNQPKTSDSTNETDPCMRETDRAMGADSTLGHLGRPKPTTAEDWPRPVLPELAYCDVEEADSEADPLGAVDPRRFGGAAPRRTAFDRCSVDDGSGRGKAPVCEAE